MATRTPSTMSSRFFASPALIFSLAALLRLVLLLYGLYQDAHSPIKYTDIDYLVFTDAARFVSRGAPPYERDTYRYTPLLAWMLLPTAWQGALAGVWFSFGKVLFALADLVAGWLLLRVLRTEYPGMDASRALKYASIWLLNPMVATISTRGSSEGLLGVIVVALLWAVLQRRVFLAGVLLGFGVHFKIYPFIYGPSVVWWLDRERETGTTATESDENRGWVSRAIGFVTPSRILLTATALATFTALNLAMYVLYGMPFLQHTYLHHLTRIDHRHNFSPYNTLLYLSAAAAANTDAKVNVESLAFIPQLLLAAVLIPVVLGKKSLPGTMLAQTFAFVAFNKVCTSQYFLWYLVFLPVYLPASSLVGRPVAGLSALLLWVLAQALWLQQAFNLEFLGLSTFTPGLWIASLLFFAVNVWILGIIVADVGGLSSDPLTRGAESSRVETRTGRNSDGVIVTK
ncbi:hypothetical protein VTN02DRAFT_6151 [Thermoascus thermophilus]